MTSSTAPGVQDFLNRLRLSIAEFDAYEDAIARQSSRLKNLSHVTTQRISTATILVTLDKALDLKELDAAICKASQDSTLEKLLEVQGHIRVRVQPRENKRSFNNCVTLSFEELPWQDGHAVDCAYNNKAIKFFSNGNLHITGCVHVRECVVDLVAKRVLPMLDTLLNSTTIFSMTHFDIQMINTDTSLDRDVMLDDLKTYCDTQHEYVPFLNPEQHLALRLVCKDKGHTIMLFSNGKLLINAPTPGKVVAARKYILDLLDTHDQMYLSLPQPQPQPQHRTQEPAAKKQKAYRNEAIERALWG